MVKDALYMVLKLVKLYVYAQLIKVLINHKLIHYVPIQYKHFQQDTLLHKYNNHNHFNLIENLVKYLDKKCLKLNITLVLKHNNY